MQTARRKSDFHPAPWKHHGWSAVACFPHERRRLWRICTGTKTVDYTYNLNGGRTGVTYKQSGETVSQSSWLYDVANRTTRITHRTAQDAAFADYQLTWDEGSNITRIVSNDGQADYAYDLLGQLIGADYDFMADESYGYDANGNDESYTIGDDNVLVSDGSSTYEHDAEGNRISKTNAAGTERELYTWDYRNRLTQVALQEYDTTISAWVTVQSVEYAYDYQNQLITRAVGSVVETFVYDNNQSILQFSGSTLTDINLWGANVDELVAVEKPVTGVIYWAYSDHLNSIRDVYTYDTATHTLTLENHLVYNAFGKITSSLSASNVAIDPILRNAYTGKYLDPITKLQTNLHRWYDPITHRWMSVDPISFGGGDTNLYRYVNNIPLINTDHDGLKINYVKSWKTQVKSGLGKRFEKVSITQLAKKLEKENICLIVLYVGHGVTKNKHSVYKQEDPVTKSVTEFSVPKDILKFRRDIQKSLLKKQNVYLGFVGCWANTYNDSDKKYAIPESQRIKVKGVPMNFDELGKDMIDIDKQLERELALSLDYIQESATELKNDGKCCNVFLFIVGSPEAFKFHGKVLRVGNEEKTVVFLRSVEI